MQISVSARVEVLIDKAAGLSCLPEKPENLGTIFSEDVNCAAQTADLTLDVFESGCDTG